MDTLATLWRRAEPVSLPAALLALYLLRQWCRTAPDEFARLWRYGQGYAPADGVVAGLGPLGNDDDVRNLADAVLRSAFRGDFAVALERAAAIFRVVASGRRQLIGPDRESNAGESAERGATGSATPLDPTAELELATRNEHVAAALAEAARHWRKGSLA